MKNLDTLIGVAMTAAGASGLTVQMMTAYLSFGAVLLNVLLALGGLILLGYRIVKIRRDLKRDLTP